MPHDLGHESETAIHPFRGSAPDGQGPADEEPAEGEAEAAERLAAEWNSALKPIDAFEVRLVDQMATQAVRIDRCQADQRDLLAARAEHAARHWDRDRAEEAEALGATIAKAPALVSRQLRRTKQGCGWIIDRWNRLALVLRMLGAWDASQARLALDLLGVPAEFRTGPTPIDLDLDGRLALIAREVEALGREQADSLDAEDRRERALAGRGGGPDADGRLAALRRHEQTCACRFEWAKEQLKKGRHAHQPGGPDRGNRPRPATPYVPPPAPRPTPKADLPRPAERTEEQWRQVLLGGKSGPPPAPSPAESKPRPLPPPENRCATPAIRQAVPPLAESGPPASENRRSRRAREARERRRARNSCQIRGSSAG